MSEGFSNCGCPVIICDKCKIEMDLELTQPYIYICPECGDIYAPDGKPKEPWSVS